MCTAIPTMKYQLAKHVSLTEVDDEVVILDLKSGAYFGLNHIGAQLMGELTQGHDVEKAITNIAQQYQVETETVERDIQSLLSQLLDQAVIERVG